MTRKIFALALALMLALSAVTAMAAPKALAARDRDDPVLLEPDVPL